MVRMGNIKIQRVRTLYSVNIDGLKIEEEIGNMNDLIVTDIIRITSTVSLIINILLIIVMVIF